MKPKLKLYINDETSIDLAKYDHLLIGGDVHRERYSLLIRLSTDAKRQGIQTLHPRDRASTLETLHQALDELHHRKGQAKPYSPVILFLAEAVCMAKGYKEALLSLSQKGPRYNIHLVVTTQAPGLIPPQIKATFQARATFRLNEENDSLSMLDSAEACFLDEGQLFISEPDKFSRTITYSYPQEEAQTDAFTEEVDRLYAMAIDYIINRNTYSFAAFQRYARCGYSRAQAVTERLISNGFLRSRTDNNGFTTYEVLENIAF